MNKQGFIYPTPHSNSMKSKIFICRLCGKNNGGEFAVGICEPCSDTVLMDGVCG